MDRPPCYFIIIAYSLESGKPRQTVVGEVYNAGQSVTTLMHLFGVQRGTILNHQIGYAMDGNPLRQGSDLLAGLDLPEEQREAALRAFE